MVVQRLKDDLESEHWRFSGVEDTVDDSPPGEGDVGEVDAERNAVSSLPLLPVMQNLTMIHIDIIIISLLGHLSVTLHGPDRVGGSIIKLVSQVSS